MANALTRYFLKAAHLEHQMYSPVRHKRWPLRFAKPPSCAKATLATGCGLHGLSFPSWARKQ